MPFMAKHVVHISEAEAASNFADVLARVRAGVEVVIESDKLPVAVIHAPTHEPNSNPRLHPRWVQRSAAADALAGAAAALFSRARPTRWRVRLPFHRRMRVKSFPNSSQIFSMRKWRSSYSLASSSFMRI